MTDWTGISGSAAADTAACPARAAFPKAVTSGSYAARGIALHRYAQQVTDKPEGRKAYLDEITDPEWRMTAEGMDLTEALKGIKVKACEISYCVNVKDKTCRLLGINIDRQYEKYADPPMTRYDIPMTLDVEGQMEDDGVPVELDYKSGQSIGEVEEHGQRRISSAALMFYYETAEAASRVAYIEEDGAIRHDGCRFTYLDAYEFCDIMVEAIDRVLAARALVAAGGTPTVYPDRDKQCRYCSSFAVCPYWTGLIRGAKDGLQALTVITPEDAGAAMEYVKDVLKVAGELEDALRERAMKEALPISKTHEFSASLLDGRKSFDAPAARGLIVTLLGEKGLTDEQVDAKINSLTKQGADYFQVRKRKRA